MTNMIQEPTTLTDAMIQLAALAAGLTAAALLVRLWLETSFPAEPLDDDTRWEMGETIEKGDA